MEELTVVTIVSALGFVVGIVFGAIAQKTNFCTMGALSDIVFMDDWNRMRSWILAIAVAMFFSQLMHINGLIDLKQSIYLTPNLGWAGSVIGGLMFGFGMTLAGGCGNKTLVRLGAGNLKSLIVFLFMGIFAYMTLRGFIGPVRLALENLTVIDLRQAGITNQSIPGIVSKVVSVNENTIHSLVTLLLVFFLLIFCFKSKEFSTSYKNIFGGVLIGTLVSVSWYITGVLGHDEFEPTPLSSLSFVAPSGNSIQYLMTFTGSTINFGIASIGGVIAGSFIMSKVSKEFRIESFTSSDDFLRHIVGAGLMGIGGVMALGCTIGQGVTGLSTLALGSIITLIAICLGGIYGLKYLEEGDLIKALKMILSRS